jgi:hypothetical protein
MTAGLKIEIEKDPTRCPFLSLWVIKQYETFPFLFWLFVLGFANYNIDATFASSHNSIGLKTE